MCVRLNSRARELAHECVCALKRKAAPIARSRSRFNHRLSISSDRRGEPDDGGEPAAAEAAAPVQPPAAGAAEAAEAGAAAAAGRRAYRFRPSHDARRGLGT